MVDRAQLWRTPRPVCAACGAPADERRCPTCRSYRPEGAGPAQYALLVLAALVLVTWVALLAR